MAHRLGSKSVITDEIIAKVHAAYPITCAPVGELYRQMDRDVYYKVLDDIAKTTERWRLGTVFEKKHMAYSRENYEANVAVDIKLGGLKVPVQRIINEYLSCG